MDATTSQQNVNNTLEQKITGLLQKYPVVLQLCKFVAIGFLNTTLDFIVFNFVSKAFNISSGLKLGQVTIPGFILAVIQSYYWNRSWAFAAAQQSVSLLKNFTRLVLVGLLGAVTFVVVWYGAHHSAAASLFLIIFVLFIVFEIVLWEAFGFSKIDSSQQQEKSPFVSFIIVSIVGLVINIALVSLISNSVKLSPIADENKNIAKVIATLVSLVWNFIGYKLFVFRK